MKLINNSNLETERLLLRVIANDDLEIIFKLRSNIEVRKYIMQTLCKTRSEAEAHLEKVLSLQEENKTITWIIKHKEENKKIGTICLWNFSEDRKTAELGYDLLPEFFNKGIMSEALKEVLLFGSKILKLNTVEAYTHQDNSNSIKLLEKFNFVFKPDRKDEEYLTNKIFTLDLN